MGTSADAEMSKKAESTGWDSNPRRRVTGVESWPLEDQCILNSEWDRRGSNPHPPG